MQAILNFIKLLPENCCRFLEEETLSKNEKQQAQHCITQIKQGVITANLTTLKM